MFDGAFSPWHLLILAVVLLLVVSPKKLASRVNHLGQSMKRLADDGDLADDDAVADEANASTQQAATPPGRPSLAYRLGRWRKRRKTDR